MDDSKKFYSLKTAFQKFQFSAVLTVQFCKNKDQFYCKHLLKCPYKQLLHVSNPLALFVALFYVLIKFNNKKRFATYIH